MAKKSWKRIHDDFVAGLSRLRFAKPTHFVYNPLVYARKPWDLYLKRYGKGPKEAMFLGMNPGPWGMAQTGIPFGEISAARDFLKLEAPVDRPKKEHPKRPILGFECHRSEVSGRRLWSWVENRFGKPEAFFERFFVANYCPLIFLEEGGRNRTPDKLAKKEKERLFSLCDETLVAILERIEPSMVIGVGKFAEKQAGRIIEEYDLDIEVASIAHPSPANPAANRGWEELIERQFKELGISLP